MRLAAPHIDEFISGSRNGALNQNRELRIYFLQIYEVMKSLKPVGDDDLRLLWIEIPRGTIDDFGDYDTFREEELVDSYEDFEEEWKAYYPDPVKWYGQMV